MTIEVDAAAAEILRRVEKLARANGETLGMYLERTLPADTEGADASRTAQEEAWREFIAKGRALTSRTVPQFVDDSREAMYRDEW